eukprot:8358697-Heterocapsa_arctica.AAC.1
MPSSQPSPAKASSTPSCQLGGATPRPLPHVADAEHGGHGGQGAHAGCAGCAAPGMAPHQAPHQEAQSTRSELPIVGAPPSP